VELRGIDPIHSCDVKLINARRNGSADLLRVLCPGLKGCLGSLAFAGLPKLEWSKKKKKSTHTFKTQWIS
jgi:hypothetical protein